MIRNQVAVIGASGVLGRNVVPRLLERGYAVRALARGEQGRAWASGLGADYRVCDILDAGALDDALAGCEVVVNLATAVPRPGTVPDWRLNDRIRTEGTINAIKACQHIGAHLVQQSIAHLVADGSMDLLDESAPVHPKPATQTAAAMEQSLAAADIGWTVLRGGAFYGPGTGRDEFWRFQSREGTLVCPGDGSAYLSMVHVADMAAAVVAAVQQCPGREVFAIVDDEPVTYRVLFDHIAALEQATSPRDGGPALWPSFRVCNDLARSRLDWAPMFASFRSGWC